MSTTVELARKASGLDEAAWRALPPVKRNHLISEYGKSLKSDGDPTGQKALQAKVAEKSADNSMQNLVDKGKMTQEEKDTRMENGKTAQTYGISPKEKAAAPKIEKIEKIEKKEPLTEIEKPEPVTFDDKAQEQAIQEVEALGVTEQSTPQDAMTAFLNKAVDEGLIEMDQNGNWKFKKYDSTTSSVLRGIGTALSVLLAIATGGQTPPINFYNVRSSNDAQAKKQFETLQNNFTETLAKLQSTDVAAEYSEAGGAEKAKEAEKVLDAGKERSADIQKEIININFQNSQQMAEFQNSLTKELLKLQNELGKDMASFNAEIAAQSLVKKINALKDSGLSRAEIAKWLKAESGVSPTDDVINKTQKIVNTVADVVGVIKPSDGRYKTFKVTKKREYISKDRR